MLLTKTAIAAMDLPQSGEQLIFDTVVPQLAVRLRPSSRAYVLILWDRTRRRKTSRTLGRCTNLTPEQARAHAQRLLAQAADGEDIRRARPESMTMAELIEAWRAEKGKSRRTADELRDKAMDYLGRLAQAPAATITREQLGAIHHHIATKARRRVFRRVGDELQSVEIGEPGLPATADKWIATVTAVYSWAQAKGIAAGNPARGIARAYDTKAAARQNYLHGDALVRFWAALEADPDADARDLLLLALYTGQRRGNVLAMRWAHVDLGAARWTIPSSETKQRRVQTCALPAQACVILQRRHADAATPWVFPATRAGADGEIGCMSETRVRAAWARICAAAQLQDVRIHDLRHTAGSWLARLGANEAIRQKALGHQTAAMAARYTHLELDPVRDAMQRVADAVTAAATAKPATVRKFRGAQR